MRIHNILDLSYLFHLPQLTPQIYKGEIFLFPFAFSFTQNLILELEKHLIQEFGINFALAENFLSQEEHFTKLSSVREKLYHSSYWTALTKEFLLKLGFQKKEWLFDYPRIRGIVTEKNRSSLASPAYYIHRDTWYGNSESQINLWIALCDITSQNGFAFYLDYFSKNVPNDSHLFSYSTWKVQGGFQSKTINKIFPKPSIPIDPKLASSFECPRGGLLVFSASHLHGTLPNRTHSTRFSLDLRVVNLRDEFWKIGAPNVDNFSQGNNLEDMILL